MAAGPFLATPLEHVPNTSVWGLTINNITMAGWGMSLVWILFFVVTALFFSEPQRTKNRMVSQQLEALLVHTAFKYSFS